MQTTPFLRVLGSADWLPTPGNDGASYTLSDKILIDTGWSAVVNLIQQGLEPLEMSTVLFTHMHVDHYMALPQLIMYWYIRRRSLEGLTLVGPAPTLRRTFDHALRFTFHDVDEKLGDSLGLPAFVELRGGDAWETGEFRMTVCDSDHAAVGLCYRIEHGKTGRVIGFSGDTQYREAFGEFFRGCDLLVHEVSCGAGPVGPGNAVSKHSSSLEAVRVAKEAGVAGLLLTHCRPAARDEALEKARELLDIPVDWAMPGRVINY